jgi:hypothetical protein
MEHQVLGFVASPQPTGYGLGEGFQKSANRDRSQYILPDTVQLILENAHFLCFGIQNPANILDYFFQFLT